MPQIGDIAKGKDIGKGTCNLRKFIWIDCSICHKTRWMVIYKGSPKFKICRRCSIQLPSHREAIANTLQGRHQPLEVIQKRAKALTGRKYTKESRERISQALKKYYQTHKPRLGSEAPMFGKKHSPESIQKMRESHQKTVKRGKDNPCYGRKPSEETLARLRTLALGHKHSEETRRKISIANTGKHHTEESKRRIGDKNRGKRPNAETRLKSSESHKRYKIPPEQRKKMIDGICRHWANISPEYKAQKVQKSLEATHMRPNYREYELLQLLNKYDHGKWRYTGNGSLMLGKRNPDFWNGDHKLIELFGEHWHRANEPSERIDYFKTFGYDTMVVWAKELHRDKQGIVRRLQEFVRSSHGD